MSLRCGDGQLIKNVVDVALGDRSYKIYIGDRVLHGIAETIKEKCGSVRAALITNAKVWDYYGSQVVEALDVEGIGYELILVPDGEQAKSLSVAEKVYGELIEKGFERKDAIIALGGGVVGDLAGFVASTYERGIAYVQVPTTLLAQVDSSVGGKVAVNHPLGKNMIGTFYQPSLVYIDVTTLSTLSERDYAGGMAEIIKYAFIKGEPLLSLLQERKDEIQARDVDVLSQIVMMSCSIKAEIVEADERDLGLRAVLNYGHTLGHAIESVSGYQYNHGEAVAIGMVFAAELSERLGLLEKKDVELHRRVIDMYGLPSSMNASSIDEFMKVMERDKKRSMGGHVFVLLDGVGNPVVRRVDDNDLIAALEAFLKEG